MRPWRTSWRRTSRLSTRAAASAASGRAISVRWSRLSSPSWAVSAPHDVALRHRLVEAGRRPRPGQACVAGRFVPARTRVRGGERCRKSIDTAAAFARPRKVIGAPAVMSASSAVCARSVAAWCWRCAAASRFSGFPQSIPLGTSGARATQVALLSSLDPRVSRGSTQTGCSARNRGAPRRGARSGSGA